MPTDSTKDTSHPSPDDLERARVAVRRVVAGSVAGGLLARMHHYADHYHALSDALFRMHQRQWRDPEMNQLLDTARTELRHLLYTLGEASVGAAIEMLEPEIDGAAFAERCIDEEVDTGHMAARTPAKTGAAS